jgi:hypothetical protein
MDEIKYLMSFYDNRFAGDHRLIFLLYNQLQRSKTIRSVAAKCISDKKYFEDFIKISQKDDFYQQLLDISRNINSKKSQEFLKNISKMLNIFAGDIPYSPLERKTTQSRLYALNHTFGLPSFFMTLSPPDQDNHLLMTIASNNNNNSLLNKAISFEVVKNIELFERLKLATKYPGLSAKFFHYLVECLLEKVLCVLPSYKVKKTKPLLNKNRLSGIFLFFILLN